ncbi:PP2C family protein-serine/threonine phosphatase [Mucilaginibacter gotjawali]|uniref:Serine/threonine phosphatase stp n=2 Tax=Mucilaginibacter gotjawali TaxID=1550579 RepID=A0A0X8X4F1_9SPHI|nr:protein phosphatase 2C domain-containing protein [Mucilaginibacter gotjawali]MBB3059161.1 serine/threonine protein phosphatase PrpC [Mucilaginibacter gotjawali]BAU54932.1 Serine/threonine phosphatase stp [Mucilaginibacter gotjawali]
MTEQFFGLTDPGKQRKNNEDTYIAEITADNQFIIACVIDGVGGYAGGEVAAALARDIILKRLEKPSGEIIPIMLDCFNQANQKILFEKQNSKEHAHMACVCSLALVDIQNNQFYFAHVGDTRLYLVRDKSLVKITHDQSFVGFLEDSGRLTEEEAMKHPKRNEINKALGLDKHLGDDKEYVETGQSPFLTGDMLLLCSDGLTDMVNSMAINAIVSSDGSLKEKCHQLVDAANQNGGADNITVVLVHNNKQKVQFETAKPVANGNKSANEKINPLTGDDPLPAQKLLKTKNKTGMVTLLFVLMLFFFAVSAYEYIKNKDNPPSLPMQSTVAVKRQKNKQEIKLQRVIDQAKGPVLILSDTSFTAPLLISGAIQINKDSLTIKAKGKIVLQSDSGYKGPAFQLSAKCKNVLLDSMSLVNFQVGITSFNNALDLKNTRFINCPVQVESTYTFPDKKYISGKLSPAAFRVDSIPLNKKK